ncbi:super-infection exclusion protein B [Providencia stuartii]|uniref:super-infection exclusion protein B n=1 Tax=Providencia stuartii TaxID=588 RepID=UPI001B72D681|nr:super-infection exclusion protein B [Providencia stuartii]MBQ0693635.1 superinfection exclusion B family protein [Providencia stuartii]
MPNWIEAALAYLKQNTSLRFNMFWLVSFVVLLVFMPKEFIDFLNSGLSGDGYQNLLPILFSIGVSFFISYFIRVGARWINKLYQLTVDPILIRKRKKIILSLDDQDLMYLLLIFSQNQERTFRWGINENISSLCKAGILKLIRYDGENSVFQINNKYLLAVQDIVMFNQEIRAKYF